MSNTRDLFSHRLKSGLVCLLAIFTASGTWVAAAPRRRAPVRVTAVRSAPRNVVRSNVVRRFPTANMYAVNPVERMVRLRLSVVAGNGVRVTLDVNQGVGRLMNHSEAMFEHDIYLAAGKTYTFTYYYEDYESDAAYGNARTWLEHDGNFLFDFYHQRRKPGGKMSVYKRSVYVA